MASQAQGLAARPMGALMRGFDVSLMTTVAVACSGTSTVVVAVAVVGGLVAIVILVW